MTDPVRAPDELLAHAAFVRRLARTLLHDEHAADDVEQETWRTAIERPPSRAERAEPWFQNVVRNFARRRWRSERRRADRERASARQEAQPAEDARVGRAETLQRVVSAVNRLREPYRATILQRYYEDLAPREIAARAGVPVATVHTRLKRALADLRRDLARDVGGWRTALGLLAGDSECLRVGEVAVGVGLMKAKTILVSFLVLSAVGAGTWQLAAPRQVEPARSRLAVVEPPAEPARSTPAPAAANRQAVLAPSTVPLARVSGRVIDEGGAGVVGALIAVTAETDPFGASDPAPEFAGSNGLGRMFESGADGRWFAELPAPARVRVLLLAQPYLEMVGEMVADSNERWVDAPAEGIDFVVRRAPTGTLEIRVVEGAAHQPVAHFSGVIRGDPDYRPVPGEPATYTGGYYSFGSEDGLARSTLVIPPEGKRLLVELHWPELGTFWTRWMSEKRRLEEEVLLRPGETRPILFVIPERGVASGFVVDELGAPIPDALVYFGEEARARGDEPFALLREELITDGVRTAENGWFELRGPVEDDPFLTAVHPRFSSATVRASAASRIVLGACGAIRGQAFDKTGAPANGTPLRLDDSQRGPECWTDEAGRFAFEHVAAGAHAIFLDGPRPLVCVRLAAGEQAELSFGAIMTAAVELELRSSEPLALSAVRGVVVGLDPVFDVLSLIPGSEPHVLFGDGTLHEGPCWLATSSGIAMRIYVPPEGRRGRASSDIPEDSTRFRVELGSAKLVVRSSTRVNVQVVPADADPFLRLVAARVYVRVQEGTDGRFLLEPGSYLLVTDNGTVLRPVEVPPAGLVVQLD